jgi:hypothetical protein
VFSKLQIGLPPSLRSLSKKEAAKCHFIGNKHYEEAAHSVTASSSYSHNKHRSFAIVVQILREVIWCSNCTNTTLKDAVHACVGSWHLRFRQISVCQSIALLASDLCVPSDLNIFLLFCPFIYSLVFKLFLAHIPLF